MRVLNVNTSIDFKSGGGMAERTFQMSHFLAKENVQCTVLTIDTGHDSARAMGLAPARLVAMPLMWRRFYIPRISWNTVNSLVMDADVVHLMGHWSLLNAVVYLAIRRTRKPYVICPAGALPIFGRSSLLKKIYNFIIGDAIVKNASGWIAVTKSEFPQFEKYGIPPTSVTVIPNGVCVEDFPVADIVSFRHKFRLTDAPFILFMGRLNPIKGPDLLLHAFSLAHERIGDFHLVFAGPDEGMQPELIEFADRRGIADKVHFLGFVGGGEKSAAYRAASLLVVPSRQEAMSLVAIEAGVCGTPVLLTDQCGFSEICSIDPCLEVPATPAGIAQGLIRVLTTPGLLPGIGPALRDFVLHRYTWTSMVPEYLSLYRRILKMSSRK